MKISQNLFVYSRIYVFLNSRSISTLASYWFWTSSIIDRMIYHLDWLITMWSSCGDHQNVITFAYLLKVYYCTWNRIVKSIDLQMKSHIHLNDTQPQITFCTFSQTFWESFQPQTITEWPDLMLQTWHVGLFAADMAHSADKGNLSWPPTAVMTTITWPSMGKIRSWSELVGAAWSCLVVNGPSQVPRQVQARCALSISNRLDPT